MEANLHPVALAHGSAVEGFAVELDDDLVEGPGLGDGVVAMTGGLLRRDGDHVEVGPRVDSAKVRAIYNNDNMTLFFNSNK